MDSHSQQSQKSTGKSLDTGSTGGRDSSSTPSPAPSPALPSLALNSQNSGASNSFHKNFEVPRVPATRIGKSPVRPRSPPPKSPSLTSTGGGSLTPGTSSGSSTPLSGFHSPMQRDREREPPSPGSYRAKRVKTNDYEYPSEYVYYYYIYVMSPIHHTNYLTHLHRKDSFPFLAMSTILE